MDATYSPDDNKLRLYAEGRLSPELFARVKAAGFRWAPKQELFVAPAWSPAREDLLLELCETIDDEDTSLVDRAEERADRFEEYSTKREADAEQAHAAVERITDGIPLGQPILVGHHSEKHARKDAERIENGMRRAVKMWKTSRYWTQRAAGALAHAKYKERPEVRARRIKTIEADRRRLVRTFTPNDKAGRMMQERWGAAESCVICGKWQHEHQYNEGNNYTGEDGHTYQQPPTPEKELHAWCGASRGGSWVPVADLEEREKRAQRWLQHYDNRLAYERAMLGEAGRLDLLEKPKRPKPPPLLNYRADGIETFNVYNHRERMTYRQVEATKAAYKRVPTDCKGTRYACDGSHRFRIAAERSLGIETAKRFEYVAVFLTDSKVHPKPQTDGEKERSATVNEVIRTAPTPTLAERIKPEGAKFDAMRETLRSGGVQAVSAPSLFPTPRELAERVIEEAGVEEGDSVLEPSAGTGMLIGAIGGKPFAPALEHNERGELTSSSLAGRRMGGIVAVEVNFGLAEQLRKSFPLTDVRCSDFLECNGDLGAFDKVVMNPPFEKGADIEHVRHAFGFLKPGGRLVSIMGEGAFFRTDRKATEFREWLDDAGGWSEPLPADSFKAAGTGVSTRIVVIDA